MTDIVEGLLWLLLLPVTCFATFAVMLAAVWFGTKIRWRR